ncbi:hypothetical protein AB205_0014050 [Aquarana catesbeiana]|uniref:Uncharacterized protein n=1 Tax=Aquarana catesbeiana TaxID=8400 RepID=A0A2G9SHH7_AQUCT|nr:hypothetical protein AB205_0014050 [Aquarana catesbeiana]
MNKTKKKPHKKQIYIRLGGCSFSLMLHLSPAGSAVRTERSNSPDCSVLPSALSREL